MSLIITNIKKIEFSNYQTLDNDTPLAGECRGITITLLDGTILQATALTTENIGIEEVG